MVYGPSKPHTGHTYRLASFLHSSQRHIVILPQLGHAKLTASSPGVTSLSQELQLGVLTPVICEDGALSITYSRGWVSSNLNITSPEFSKLLESSYPYRIPDSISFHRMYMMISSLQLQAFLDAGIRLEGLQPLRAPSIYHIHTWV